MVAFELALKEGATGIEFDVRLDRDANVIVLHDRDLKRVTQGERKERAEALTSQDFRSIELGGGARVPALAEVLSWAKTNDCLLNVELKSDVGRRHKLAENVARVIADSGIAAEQLLLSSFHLPLLRASAARLPDVASAWLFDRNWLGSAVMIGLSGAQAVHPAHGLITPARARHWRSQVDLVNTWTVNDSVEAVRLMHLGVDTIISDTPGQILETLRTATKH